MLIGVVNAVDSSNWTTADVGYETFKIPPNYSQNPYQSDFNMYEFDEDIDVFTIRYVNPKIWIYTGILLKEITSEKFLLMVGMQFTFLTMTGMMKPTIQYCGFQQVRNSIILHGEEMI